MNAPSFQTSSDAQCGSLLWLLTLGGWWWWGHVETEAFFLSFLHGCVL